MNEREVERAILDWMSDDRTAASPWVVESVLQHARRHPRSPWWRRAFGIPWPAVPPAADRDDTRSRLPMTATAAAAGLITLLVTIAIAVSPPRPVIDLRPSPSPSMIVPRGSLWQEVTERGQDTYLALHPDGIAVTLTRSPGRQIGIGVWQPTGRRTLVTLIAYPDADPVNHVRYGFSTYRAEVELDGAAEVATMRWTASFEPGDGSSMPDQAGATTFRRLHLQALPADARYPVPSEPAWEPILASAPSGGHGGLVVAMPACSTTNPADQLVLHGDGTTLYAGLAAGQGIGLWAETGPGTRAISAWYGSAVASRHQQWVAEMTGSRQLGARTGTSSEFDGSFWGTARVLEPMDGPVPEADPTLWPATGSVWLERTDVGTTITAYLADGTVIARDPRYGTGAGLWQPVDANTLVSSVAYPGRAIQDHRISTESTVDPGGKTLSIRYRHIDRFAGTEADVGTATAVRLALGS